MMETPSPAHAKPHKSLEDPEQAEEAVVNDSLGTVNTADSTGTDEDLETGDARDKNFDTRED
jgi:hypothetical protein